MATQPDDDEPLELTEELEPDDPPENPDDDPEGDPENPDDEGEETPTVSFEDEEPSEPDDNSVIRQMRQELRETKRKLAEAEKIAQPKPVEVGPKPGLWDDDIAGDEEVYDKRLLEWQRSKDAVAKQSEAQAEQTRKVNEEWQSDLQAFEKKKAALEFNDVDDAIETANLSLDLVQQAVIVKAAADPALFLYALAKSDAKRSELSKIQDPIKLAAAVARMEGAVKVTKGRKAPEPDRPLRGSAPMPGGADKEMEKMEREAARTGDRTKIIAHKAKLAEAAKAK